VLTLLADRQIIKSWQLLRLAASLHSKQTWTAIIKPSCCFDAGGTEWQTALVTNRCPECLFGSIDQAIDGNGRWQVQWFATPCPVGNSKLMYSITVIDQYWFSLVVSNTL